MQQYELNLNDYWRIIRKRKLVIIFSFLIVIAVAAFYFSGETPVYQAASSVKIEERKTMAGLLTELVAYSPGDVMESACKIITGFPVMKKAALRMGMINEESPLEKVIQSVTQLQGDITTQTVKQTNIIEITVTCGEAKKAMDLANTVAEVYIEDNLAEKNKQASAARKFISEQLASLGKKLESTEERLRVFGSEVKGIRVSPSIQNKLTELEFTLLDLRQKYTDKHPAVRQVTEQIKDLEAQLNGFSGQELEYARLNREVEVNRKLYAMLKEKLEEARITEAQKVSDVSMVNPAVMPTAPLGTQKRTGMMLGGLTGLVLGIILAFVWESLDTSIGTIEDVEDLLKLPVLGVVPSIKLEHKGRENFLQKYFNKFFPLKHTRADDAYARLIVHYEPKSLVAEAYRAIRTNLKISPSLKTLLITSASPQEGKSTVLTNLGLAITQTGMKTLLVSTDLRRPSIARTFGLKEQPGINEVITKVVDLDDALCNASDIMMGEMKLEKIMETPGIENICILPSGNIPMNPAEILESKGMDSLMDELKNRFDIILFDSPPVLPVTDAVLLAAKVDGVILVYEAGRTARSVLLRAKTQLEAAGAKILGVVLNHIKAESEVTLNYPYYKYRYCGEELDKISRKRINPERPKEEQT